MQARRDTPIGMDPITPKNQVVDTEMRRHIASQKDLLDGARDPLGFNAGVTDPTNSSRDVPVNFTLQLTRRESLLVI